MSLYDKYRETDYWDDVSFIAGSDMDLNFYVYDENGNPVDVLTTPTASCQWFLGYYSDPSAGVLLSKYATRDSEETHLFTVSLSPSDTESLGDDIYLQQIIVTDGDGKNFKPGQGIVIIRKAIT